MAGTSELSKRIKAEFDQRQQRLETQKSKREQDSREQDARLERFGKVCDELKSVWEPRLKEFAAQFGDQVKVTPSIKPSERQATVSFLTDLATVALTLSATTGPGLESLILNYDLYIIPIFLDYERYARLEMPLDQIDKAEVGRWLDDQLVKCVQTYLAIQDNQYYLKRAADRAPVAAAR